MERPVPCVNSKMPLEVGAPLFVPHISSLIFRRCTFRRRHISSLHISSPKLNERGMLPYYLKQTLVYPGGFSWWGKKDLEKFRENLGGGGKNIEKFTPADFLGGEKDIEKFRENLGGGGKRT